MMRPHPGPLARATPPRSVAYLLVRIVLLGLIAAMTVVLSVVASALGLSVLVVVAAIGSMMTLKVRQQMRAGYTPNRSRRALLVTGLAVLGFFLIVSVVGAYWPK